MACLVMLHPNMYYFGPNKHSYHSSISNLLYFSELPAGMSLHLGICVKDKRTFIKYIERSFCISVRRMEQPMIRLHQQWWRSQESLAAPSPMKNTNFHRWGGCRADLAHCALSGHLDPGGSFVHISPAPTPVCHLCSQRSFFFSLCDRDFSSTAECRLSLHMNQLLYKRQLHAGAAYKPLPFLNKTL